MTATQGTVAIHPLGKATTTGSVWHASNVMLRQNVASQVQSPTGVHHAAANDNQQYIIPLAESVAQTN
jgi:hypothetical protein